MGLTSRKFLVLIVIIAVALCALVVWLWPRAAKKGVVPLITRVGLLVLAQLGILSALLIAANDAFGFYSSWNDLFGVQSPRQILVPAHGGKAGRTLAPLTVQGQVSAGLAGGRETAGYVEQIEIHGPLTGLSMNGYVYLPPQYAQQGHERDRFPVVVAVTGYPGVAKNLITQLKIPQTASADIVAKKIKPTIYVMVRPSVVPGRDTNCTDVPGGPQALSFFNQDLPLAISSHYRTANGPGSWGAIGNSTGGYCALKFAMTDPVRYGAAAGLSTDYFARQDSATGDLYAGSQQVKSENDLLWRVKHMPPPPVSLLLTSSRRGEPNYHPTLDFVARAKPPTRVTTLIRAEGGHNFQTWRAAYPVALRWLDTQLPAADKPPQ